jgi:hypothetical protein
MDSEFVKKRLEKDLQELKKMIEKHFEQRKEDEASIQQLEERIVKRKELRAQQLEERAKAEKARLELARIEKEKKMAQEEAKRAEEAERKKAALAALNVKQGPKTERKKGRGTERDRKKKILAERRKPLNIDHLDVDKLKTKAKALWEHLQSLEDKRFDCEKLVDTDKYNIQTLRCRINMQQDAVGKDSAKRRRIGKLQRK